MKGIPPLAVPTVLPAASRRLQEIEVPTARSVVLWTVPPTLAKLEPAKTRMFAIVTFPFGGGLTTGCLAWSASAAHINEATSAAPIRDPAPSQDCRVCRRRR